MFLLYKLHFLVGIYQVLADGTSHKRDLKSCKVTHKGLNYVGHLSQTEQGIRCQKWSTDVPIHAISPEIQDDKFPEKSMVKAKNYCRNPTHIMEGPWCYTISVDVERENCDIPLCVFDKCRITGPGMEYAGKLTKSVTTEKCMKWDKNWDMRKLKLTNGSVVNGHKFSRFRVPKKDLGSSSNYCRNPDGDLGGKCFCITFKKSNKFSSIFLSVVNIVY